MKFESKHESEVTYNQNGIIATILPGQELELSNDVGVLLLENETLAADIESGSILLTR